MKVIDPGHIYELEEVGSQKNQRIIFIKKTGEHQHHQEEWPGVYNQELIRILIDRTQYLNTALPSLEYRSVIEHLRYALYQLEMRALKIKQGNDDTLLPSLEEIVLRGTDIEKMKVGDDGLILRELLIDTQ
jgi:hypothetical protein